jgi:PLP dependent protein
MEDIANNVNDVQRRIEAACLRAGRDPSEITVVAVSKTRTLADIKAAYACGLRHFGENRVEEAQAKIPEVETQLGSHITWHMIGHIQSRKARDAAQFAHVVHSVDSVKLARRLERAAREGGRILPVLVECNVSGEGSKYGFDASDKDRWEELHEPMVEIARCSNLQLRGLMTMAPIVEDPELARPVFVKLRRLRDALETSLPGLQLPELSMGMTDDFEVAVEEGATMLRIGRAIFGPATY